MHYTECHSHANVTFATVLNGAATYKLMVSRPSRERKTKNTTITADRTNLQMMSAVRKCQHVRRLLVLQYRMTNHEISSSFSQYEIVHLAYHRIIFERNDLRS